MSSMCDAIFLEACIQIVLNGDVQRVQFTDSSSARQLVWRNWMWKSKAHKWESALGSATTGR